MAKTEKKKPAPKKTSPKKAVAKKATPKKAAAGKSVAVLSKDDAESLLKSFHRVLRNKEVEHPVQLQFATDEGKQCMKWDCRTINGQRVCGWFPC